MKIILKTFTLLITATIILATPSYALTILKNGDAEQYLKDTKAHILASNYSYEILSRNHRDSMHGRFSDGVIFSPNNGKFLFLRKKDGDCIVVIGDPKGREEAPVNEAAWREKIQNTLSDDNTIPYVFLDDNKKELAIVFLGKGTQISAKTNADQFLELTILVEGARDLQRSSRRRH